MNFENYRKYIVVDEHNASMTFDGEQFVYCTNHRSRIPTAVKTYSYKQAIVLIRETAVFRIRNGFQVGDYNLIPVEPRVKRKTKKK